MCEREYDYHRFNNEYVYPQSILDKEICIEKIYNSYEFEAELEAFQKEQEDDIGDAVKPKKKKLLS